MITSAALEKLLVNYAGKYATGDEIYLVCLSWPLESRLYAAYTVFRSLGWAWAEHQRFKYFYGYKQNLQSLKLNVKVLSDY